MFKSVFSLLLASLAALTLAFTVTGCGGGGSSKIDLADLKKAFATADASLKGPADEAAKALAEGKLFEGATGLVNLAKTGGDKLTSEQKNALINVGASIQMAAAEQGDKADLKVLEAAEALQAIETGGAAKPAK